MAIGEAHDFPHWTWRAVAILLVIHFGMGLWSSEGGLIRKLGSQWLLRCRYFPASAGRSQIAIGRTRPGGLNQPQGFTRACAFTPYLAVVAQLDSKHRGSSSVCILLPELHAGRARRVGPLGTRSLAIEELSI
jgi:hypothetical protein